MGQHGTVLPHPGSLRYTRGHSRLPYLLLTPLIVVLLAFVVWPIAVLVVESLKTGGNSYVSVFTDPTRARVLGTTLWQSAVSAVLTLLLGLLIAWTLRITKRKWLKILLWAAIIVPMWMSVVVKNYAWTMILGRQGPINGLLGMLGLPQVDMLYTPFAVVIGMVYTLFPLAVMPTYLALTSIPENLIAAAKSLGARPWTVLGTVVFPMAKGTILVVAILMYVLTAGFYVTPIILGGSRSTFISRLVQDDIFLRFDTASAAATSVIILLVAVGLIFAAVLAVGRKRFEEALG